MAAAGRGVVARLIQRYRVLLARRTAGIHVDARLLRRSAGRGSEREYHHRACRSHHAGPPGPLAVGYTHTSDHTLLGAQQRPLVVPVSPGTPVNAPGLLERSHLRTSSAACRALPVVVDSSIPTTRGASTIEDVLIVARVSDLYLWEEGAPRSRLLSEVLSGTLQVRAQVYGYFAFTGARYPSSVALTGPDARNQSSKSPFGGASRSS
jgi:hypothetical protein